MSVVLVVAVAYVALMLMALTFAIALCRTASGADQLQEACRRARAHRRAAVR